MEKTTRNYYPSGMTVSKDGKEVRNLKDGRLLTIKQSKDGRKYVQSKVYGKVWVDEMVATCFCHRDKSSRNDYIIHKDGDIGNSDAGNLQWVDENQYTAQTGNPPTMEQKENARWRWASDGFWVTASGEVKDKDGAKTVEDTVFDPDLDCEQVITPCVRYSKLNRFGSYERKSKSLEELVAGAFCDKPKDLKRPAILHKDNNYKNCNADNLQWVEADSPEYQQFKRQEQIDWNRQNQQFQNNSAWAKAASIPTAPATTQQQKPRPSISIPERKQMDGENAYDRWTPAEDNLIDELYKSGMSYSQIASKIKRGEGAVRSRLKKHGLIK